MKIIQRNFITTAIYLIYRFPFSVQIQSRDRSLVNLQGNPEGNLVENRLVNLLGNQQENHLESRQQDEADRKDRKNVDKNYTEFLKLIK